MKRILLTAIPITILCLTLSSLGLAQQSASDAPATKEDIQRYLEVMHSRDMMTKMIDAMSQPMHQMIHDQYEKEKEKLPPDFEARASNSLDQMLSDLPLDEIIQSMIPAYQRHLTKGDVDALVAFYSSPTGKKLLREMPEMMAESMNSIMPIMQRHAEKITERLQQQIAAMKTESKKDSSAKN